MYILIYINILYTICVFMQNNSEINFYDISSMDTNNEYNIRRHQKQFLIEPLYNMSILSM